MVNWYEDQAGRLKVTRVALADLDHAAKLESRSEFDVRIGNVMWRSPEAQVGRGVGKPSDVFSYGLLVREMPPAGRSALIAEQCLYVITGIETMHPDFGRLRAKGIAPEVEILSRCITFFGPVPSGLVRHVDDEYWEAVFLRLCQGAALEPYVPRFEEWDEDYCRNLEPETNRLIARMTNLDPAARPSMCEVAEDLEEWAGY
jgi:serine/threonine protein kinase